MRLVEVEWMKAEPQPMVAAPPAIELERRLEEARRAMRAAGLTHLVVYADREHFGNLWWLTHFDPRFEEALLILREGFPPLILVGNECQAYLKISPLLESGALRSERFAEFSLLNQVREGGRELEEIFRSEGVGPESRVGCLGWKTYPNRRWTDIPAYLVDGLRALAGPEKVECATTLFTDPADGLRARCGAWEIAYFEASNWKASEAMKRVLEAVRPGARDFDLLAEARYDGTPLSCHMTCKTGLRRVSLASPRGDIVEPGVPWSANIGYWGSNICRAGWVPESPRDLPARARGYIDEFAGPYFAAMAAWFQMMRIGASGGEVFARMAGMLPFDRFGVWLNPGHLIHGEEWLSSPIYEGSEIPLASGMVIQSDVIPSSQDYFSARLEDGYALADQALREELQERFADCWERCQTRRRLMEQTLGLELPPELLPLSNLAGMMMPFVLRPRLVFSMK